MAVPCKEEGKEEKDLCQKLVVVLWISGLAKWIHAVLCEH